MNQQLGSEQQRMSAGAGGAPAARIASPPSREAVGPRDPAVQVVESAHQILTMIGANPRAIRPILAQRRLTPEAVLAAAASAHERVTAVLLELEAAGSAPHAGADAADVRGFATVPTTMQNAPAGTGQAAPVGGTRVPREQQTRHTYLAGLRERAARVAEVYQSV